MKKYLLIILLFTFLNGFAQDFNQEWREVIQLELDGKIKSAQERVNSIYKKAKRKNVEDQIIKCFFYQSKFLKVRDENAQSLIIKNITEEIADSKNSKKALLSYIYINILENYYERNRYIINNRTNLAVNDSKNFITWSKNDFNKEINKLYSSLLKDENQLHEVSIKKYNSIFEISPYTDAKKWSVYDFLQHKTLRHYFNDFEDFSNKKSNKIITSLLSDSKEFGKVNVDTIVNKELKEIIKLFQNNEKYVLKNSPKEIHSLQYDRMNQFSEFIQDKEFYFSQLAILQKKTTDLYLIQNIKVDFANHYYTLTSKTSETNHYSEVLLLIESVLNQKENPSAKANMEILKEKILKKTISIYLEDAFYSNQHYRAFVTFKNVDSIKVHYYKIPVSIYSELQLPAPYYGNSTVKKIDRDSLVLKYVDSNKPVKSTVKVLPNKTDHFEYTTEILMDSLDVGHYLIFFETKNPYYTPKTAYAYKAIQISNINFVQQENNDFDTFNLLHRKTGKPIENAIIKNDVLSVRSDKTGKAKFKLTEKNGNSYSNLLFIMESDTLHTSYVKSSVLESRNDENFDAKSIVFFDRAIYRPGQKVFFKGYMFQNKNNIKSVVSDLTLRLIIEDANYDEVETFDLKTNEFGSFTGEYDIPKNVLTGEFRIKIEEPDNYETDSKYYNKKEKEHLFWDKADYDNDRSFRFQVEEYKRPTFEIIFDKITENYTIGDSIRIKGTAKNLAGSNLTNAKVAYTFSKNVSLKNDYFENNFNKTDGETTTDEKGNFEIRFTASQDSIANADIKVINFQLEATITDLNGETRSQSSSVIVATEMLKLNFNIGPELLQEDKNMIEIFATTLNNFPINAKGTITFIEQNRKDFLIKKERLPELNNIERIEYERLFPNESYVKEDVEITEKEVLTIPFDTEKSTVVDLSFLRKLKLSNYRIIVKAIDQKGNEISRDRTFKLISKNKKADNNSLFTYIQLESDKNDFKFEIKSVIPDLYITTRIFDGSNQTSESVIQLKKGYALIKIPRKFNLENDIQFHFSTFWENTYFADQITIAKEDIKNQLDFEIVSMRNKIEPGSLENWSFVLKNSKIQSEVLASMYDTSLDQFAKSDWTFDDFYRKNKFPLIKYKTSNWYNNTVNFRNLYFTTNYHNTANFNPELNWFGFSFADSNKYLNEQYLRKVNQNAAVPKNATLIEGLVSGSAEALAGAVVAVEGTTRFVVSDFDGQFKIDVARGEILVVSYIGYKTAYRIIDNKQVLHIILEEGADNILDEVVISSTGYSRTRTKNETTSAVTVSANKFRWNGSFLNTLAGSTPGLSILSASGQPGSAKIDQFIRGMSSINSNEKPLIIIDGVPISPETFRDLNQAEFISVAVLRDAAATSIYGSQGANGVLLITTKNEIKALEQVKARTNFNETAFFYPNLTTDLKGAINFSFTTPESLTKWRLRLFGHNKKAEMGYFQKDIISQKDIMVMPNMPRFVREKDVIQFSTKVVNMTNETKSGNAILLLFNAATNTAIDSITMNSDNVKPFNCKSKESVSVSWTVTIPEGVQGLRYKVIAKSGTISDGEENILPVLTDKILITESIPIWVKGNTKREFTLQNLKNNTSSTLQNHALTFEYTSNPMWIALQSLPYLMNYEHECSEQVFAKYYANCIAEKIITSDPKIEKLFQKWQEEKSVESKLKMNDELKSIVLAETPWLLDAESDEEKNKRFAVLMDLNTLKQNNSESFKKLEDKMLATGGFPWFSGGTEDRYISQHILSGIGHLNALFPEDSLKYKNIVSKGVPNLDSKFVSNYSNKNKIVRPSTLDLNYLYTRSFYLKNYPLSPKADSLVKLQLKQSKEDWLTYSLYEKGLLALIMNRFKEKDFAKKIISSLKETASNNDEIGMYWIENKSGYGWYQSNIATQSLLIEAFAEIDNDKETIDAMKVWLIKNKQTNRWSSTKSTSEAVYALMSQGSDWTSLKENTKVKIGDEKLLTKKLLNKDEEQQMGYLKIQYKPEEITSKMATVSIDNKTAAPGFGGIYWQYFESLKNIKKDSTQTISIDKKLFKKVNTAKGAELIEIKNDNVKVGDLVTVRLIVKTENDLEFVHLKDLRASCLEPVDVISGYEWKGNFSYYKSTKDVSTNFFFDRLKKGTYVLEYDLRVTNQGDFNNGISTLQSMYAPEFSAHSENMKIKTD